jgi:membrane protein implicated in regulation of membrane protease activity
MMENYVYIWLIVGILFLLFEMSSPGLFYFLSFAIGAAVAAIGAVFEVSVITQCVLFLANTVLALVVLKMLIAPQFERHHAHQRTNVDALRGKRAVVCKRIEPHNPGEVEIDGHLWLARTSHERTIEVGTEVEIKDIRGSHVVVAPVEKNK